MSVNLDGPREYDLSEIRALRVRPGEDVVLMLDFEQDMSSATHRLVLEEHDYPYMPAGYSKLDRQERETFDTSSAADGIIKHEISASDTQSWDKRRLDLRWEVTDDGSTWVAVDRTMAILQGD